MLYAPQNDVSPLILASIDGHHKVVELLIKAGVRVNLQAEASIHANNPLKF